MRIILTTFLLALTISSWGQKKYQLKSPDGKLVAAISLSDKINYVITHQGDTILKPSVLNMSLDNGTVWGKNSQLKNAKTNTHHQQINALFYKRNQIDDHYNELVLSFKESFNLIFRAYNEGIAYRFVSTSDKAITIKNEEAVFNFTKDFNAYVPYVKGKFKDIESQYFNSFENEYTYTPLSKISADKLAFYLWS
ncbi:glycoside hydrolase family 97 N-terminal domain-containing protein [Pedobacter sp. SL55]|uniref:glycoside hydrolase family 97 N-terminal domain-containing protein n=1 Tax=Pedobacter sp. SL55 TaxID=2995161 RepID=UPI00226FD027|nr:glycoside hydrolase family 97 N-terminal domain-containing protein [Pedobacter sp. SL55]WAC39553.1 glycoside hydrolase family 97 N-terminal domain-containing protein [Pedobacter sp. SL55]